MLNFRVPLVTLFFIFSALMSVQALASAPVQNTVASDLDHLILSLPGQQPVRLAAAGTDGAAMKEQKSSGKMVKPIFKERMFTANKVHKYLGIGSIGMALLAAIAPKEEDGAHEYLARGAAAAGIAAVATGFVFHHDDLELKNGFGDPDNLHALLTSVGTLGYVLAVSNAPAAHAGYGVGGAISMLVGIKMTW